LQCNNAALDEVESVVISDPIVVKAVPTEDLSVAAPEVLSAGESLAATIASHTGRRSVTITVRDEHGRVVTEVEKAMRTSTIEYRTEPLDPGGYSLEVRDLADIASTSGVNSTFLVWPE
jgi:predicted phage tail protein